MRIAGLGLTGWLALACLTGGAMAADFENSIVEVFVTYQEYNPHQPWQKRQPGVRRGYGIVIDNAHLLTTEDLVRNSTLIELRRARSGEKFRAVTEHADYQADVAVLKITDVAAVGALTPVNLATNVPADAGVELVQLDNTGALQRESGTVLRISVSSLPQAPNVSLVFTVLTDMDVNGPGVAVFHEGALAGLVMQYDKDSRTAHMLPYTVLKRFLEASARPVYPGVASAGLTWTALVDPVKRAYLGAPNNSQGVMVLATFPGTGAADALQPGDVMIEMDGYLLDNLGYYNDPDFGRLLLPYLISGRHYPGDKVPVTVIRKHKKISVPLTLTRLLDANWLIPENVQGVPAEYCADGGYIIRELTGDYLRSYGTRWETQTDPRLVHLYLSRSKRPDQPGQKVVILSRVLPDAINLGYQDLRDDIITQINGAPIHNMSDVFRILDRDGGLHRITLQGIGVDLVLDAQALAAANARIAKLYSIPSLRSRHPAPAP